MLRIQVEDAVLERPLMRMELKHPSFTDREAEAQRVPGGTGTPIPSELLQSGNMKFVECSHLPLTVFAT